MLATHDESRGSLQVFATRRELGIRKPGHPQGDVLALLTEYPLYLLLPPDL